MEPTRRTQLLQIALNPFSLIIILGACLLISDFSWSGFGLWSFAFANWGIPLLCALAGLYGYHTPFTNRLTAKQVRSALDADPARLLGLTDPHEIAMLRYYTGDETRFSDREEKRPRTTTLKSASYAAGHELRDGPDILSDEWDELSDEQHTALSRQSSERSSALVEAGKRLYEQRLLAPAYGLRSRIDLDEDQYRSLRLGGYELARRLRSNRHVADAPDEVPADLTQRLSEASLALQAIETTRAELESQVKQLRAPYLDQAAQLEAQKAQLSSEADEATAAIEVQLAQLPVTTRLAGWEAYTAAMLHIQEHGIDALQAMDGISILDEPGVPNYSLNANLYEWCEAPAKPLPQAPPEGLRVYLRALKRRRWQRGPQSWEAQVVLTGGASITVTRTGTDRDAVLADTIAAVLAQLARAVPPMPQAPAAAI